MHRSGTRRIVLRWIAPLADNDALVVIATHLRPEEAGMLRGLLESAGIVAVLRDDMLSSLNPFLQPAGEAGGPQDRAGQLSLRRAILATRDARSLGSPGPADRLALPPAVSSPCQVRSAISTTCSISSRLAPSAA